MARQVASAAQVYGPSSTVLTGGAVNLRLNTPVGGTNGSVGGGPADAVPIQKVGQNLAGSIFGQPITWLFGLVLFLVAWKLIEEHRGGEAAFHKIRVDGTNIVKVGVMATIFLIIIRYFAARYSVPGASDLILGGT